jgi:hypothetical protein
MHRCLLLWSGWRCFCVVAQRQATILADWLAHGVVQLAERRFRLTCKVVATGNGEARLRSPIRGRRPRAEGGLCLTKFSSCGLRRAQQRRSRRALPTPTTCGVCCPTRSFFSTSMRRAKRRGHELLTRSLERTAAPLLRSTPGDSSAAPRALRHSCRRLSLSSGVGPVYEAHVSTFQPQASLHLPDCLCIVRGFDAVRLEPTEFIRLAGKLECGRHGWQLLRSFYRSHRPALARLLLGVFADASSVLWSIPADRDGVSDGAHSLADS